MNCESAPPSEQWKNLVSRGSLLRVSSTQWDMDIEFSFWYYVKYQLGRRQEGIGSGGCVLGEASVERIDGGHHYCFPWVPPELPWAELLWFSGC